MTSLCSGNHGEATVSGAAGSPRTAAPDYPKMHETSGDASFTGSLLDPVQEVLGPTRFPDSEVPELQHGLAAVAGRQPATGGGPGDVPVPVPGDENPPQLLNFLPASLSSRWTSAQVRRVRPSAEDTTFSVSPPTMQSRA